MEAESYPLDLEGKGFESFTINVGAFNCKETGLEGRLPSKANSLPLEAQYSSCTTTTGAYPSRVRMHSCDYVLGVKNVGPPYTGTLGVACDKPGDAIEFEAFLGTDFTGLVCRAKLGPQVGRDAVQLANTGQGTERQITLDANATGFKYELSGPCNSNKTEVRNDGAISGKTALFGA